MNTLTMILTEVRDKYPAQPQKIEDLFVSNADFRSICLDYSYCKQSISKLKQEFVDKKDAIKDFEQMLHDLENEMKLFIEK